MLIDVDTGKVIEQVPFQRDFGTLRGRLTAAEFEGMVGRVNELIDASGSEIATAAGYPAAIGPGRRSNQSTRRQPAMTSSVPRCSSASSSGTRS